MKTRRHHNNKGVRQIQTGAARKKLEKIAKKLGIPFKGSEYDSRNQKKDSTKGEKEIY